MRGAGLRSRPSRSSGWPDALARSGGRVADDNARSDPMGTGALGRDLAVAERRRAAPGRDRGSEQDRGHHQGLPRQPAIVHAADDAQGLAREIAVGVDGLDDQVLGPGRQLGAELKSAVGGHFDEGRAGEPDPGSGFGHAPDRCAERPGRRQEGRIHRGIGPGAIDRHPADRDLGDLAIAVHAERLDPPGCRELRSSPRVAGVAGIWCSANSRLDRPVRAGPPR